MGMIKKVILDKIKDTLGICEAAIWDAVNLLSEYLGVRPHTLYTWVSQRRIPFVKCGRLTKFDLKAIDNWISKNSIKNGS